MLRRCVLTTVTVLIGIMLTTPRSLAAQGASADLAGTWEFTVEAGGDTHHGRAVFTLSGSEVGGTLFSDRGESAITGTLTDRALTFTTILGDLTIKWTGEIKGDEMAGTLDYGEGPNPWKARKTTDK